MRSPFWILSIVTLAAGCGGGSGSGDASQMADARVPAGTMSLSWTILEDGNPRTCAEVGNLTVQVVAVPEVGGAGDIDTLSCQEMSGMTRPFPVGRYRVTVRLGQLDESEPMPGVVVQDGQNTPLGSVTFNVVASGGVKLTMSVVNATGDNCADELSDGGGIDQFVLELWDAARTTCAPTTFMVGTESYASDCAGARFRCIAKTESVEVTGLFPGAHYLRIQGYEGDTLCYPFDALVNAPAGGVVADEGNILLRLVDPAPDGGPALCVSP